MSIASEYNGYDQDNLLFDRETWEINFEEMIEKSPDTAENLARVLLLLLEAIESGPEGIAQASNSLKDGIEWAYLYTDAHRTAFRLFLLYIEGRLLVPDEPNELIRPAIARGIALLGACHQHRPVFFRRPARLGCCGFRSVVHGRDAIIFRAGIHGTIPVAGAAGQPPIWPPTP